MIKNISSQALTMRWGGSELVLLPNEVNTFGVFLDDRFINKIGKGLIIKVTPEVESHLAEEAKEEDPDIIENTEEPEAIEEKEEPEVEKRGRPSKKHKR